MTNGRTPLRLGSLCTGYGGLDMALQASLHAELAWVADPDPGAARILQHRHPDVPNLGDITDICWGSVEPVDLLTAGFPCQDISNAGLRAGIEGARSGIYFSVVEAVRVVRPRLVFLENVSALVARGLDRVIAELASLGYVGSWRCVRASEVGAPHRRERIFILAWPADAPGPRLEAGRQGRPGGGTDADPTHLRHQRGRTTRGRRAGPENGGRPAAHTAGVGYRHSGAESLGGFPATAVAGDPAAGWGPYEPAISRWEAVTGRAAPVPTEPGRTGRPRLSPRFVEWLMGLPAGWVTDAAIGLTRNQQLRALGNGVVPQQGSAAVATLLQRTGHNDTRT
ncbi:DNA cytosine methyltransferase [Nocardiopsis sp. MG754419]|uniref:DNA cytosine methyltransferase n=1 Tax=Nocardiopsis sp. MG754419 TaxID=2259865 RepID=UPI001BAA30C5|nr:DNA cytosine methyltransferase [Nocardiopsis sp. MG754419]MBR8745216.1 DNA cytosine methyltransferase [Nocardiopsis sp. MG754419]